jgi:hypothetical protein
MKKLILIFFSLILISCTHNKRKDHTLPSESLSGDNFEWLAGSWMRTNDQEGNQTFEHWIKNSDTEYTAMGCTLHKGDTIFKEHLRLIRTGDKWNLEVSGVNENPTSFLMISYTENSFVCENKQNEFPKHIAYSIQDGLLNAKIFDDDKEITFLFERMQLK